MHNGDHLLKVGAILGFQMVIKPWEIMPAALKPISLLGPTPKSTWGIVAILKSERHIGFWNDYITVRQDSSSL